MFRVLGIYKFENIINNDDRRGNKFTFRHETTKNQGRNQKNRDNEIKIYVCTMDKNLYDVAHEFLYGITRYLIFPNLSSSKKIYSYNMSCICNSS